MDYTEALDIENSQLTDDNNKPIWKIDKNDDAELLKWLNKEFKYLMKINRNRHTLAMENLMIYRGVQYSPNDQKTLNDFLDTSRVNQDKRRQKLIVNHLYDLTETIVSRSTRGAPRPDVLPANSEEIHDRNAAKSVLKLLDYIAYTNDLPKKKISLKRQAVITGESYISTLWNPDIGDIHPLWAKAKENGFKTAEGKDIYDEKGKKLNPNNPIRVGDIELKLRESWRVLLQDGDCWDDLEYCFIVDVKDIDKLKEDYPKKKDELKPMDSDKIWDSRHMSFRELRNESIFITFFHKKTKYFPKGIEIKFTLDCLLEKEDYKYEHGKLPIVRLTDVDIEGELHAESSFEQVKNLQWRHNQITSDIVTNQRLCAKPKWLVPKGRVSNINTLGNDITIVQYSGNIAPRLESANPTPPELFIFRKDLKEDMEQLMTVTGTARRTPPPGARASVSMKFLSELEAERISVSTAKDNDFMKDLYVQMMSLAGTFYDVDDGRTMRILGNDQEYHISDVIVSNLNKSYDVIIKNSTVLTEMKSIKEARLLDFLQVKPDILPDERLVEAMELGSMEKATSIITEAMRAAENENEEFFSDAEVLEPAPYEDHIIHWDTHVQKLQSHAIKQNARLDHLDKLEEHIWGTEFLMVEKAKENPTFNAQLANLALFPIYYKSGQGFTPSSKAQQEAVVQGQANRGDDITEKIAGQLPEEIENKQDKK